MKKYWFCVVEVEVTDEIGLPDGADSRMRRATRIEAEAIAGIGNVGEFFSGWGLSEAGAKVIKLESIMPANNGH